MREHADLLDKTLPSFHTKGKTFGNVLLSPFLTKVPGCCRICECSELRGAERKPFLRFGHCSSRTKGNADLGHSCQLSLFVYLKIHDSSLSTSNPLKRIIEDEVLTQEAMRTVLFTPICCSVMTPAFLSVFLDYHKSRFLVMTLSSTQDRNRLHSYLLLFPGVSGGEQSSRPSWGHANGELPLPAPGADCAAMLADVLGTETTSRSPIPATSHPTLSQSMWPVCIFI